MILTQPDIRKAVEAKEIVFDPPLQEDQWGEASVDLRLGWTFTTFSEDEALESFTFSVAKGLHRLANMNFWQTTDFRQNVHMESFKLRPRKFVLAMTHERIVIPPYLIGLVEGRSTYTRVGLSMHQTAPWIQPGWDGQIVLEIMNNGPLNLELTPELDRPCQLTFFELKNPLPPDAVYGSRPQDTFQRQTHPIKPPTKKS